MPSIPTAVTRDYSAKVTEMLRPVDVLEKTEKGHEELRTRQYKLPAKMRALLLMVDGNQPVAGLQEQMQELGFAEDALEALLEQGFVKSRSGAPAEEAPAPAAVSAPDKPAAADGSPFAVARKHMNESVFKTLGLKGFFFTLKIEKSSNMEDLRELLPEYEEVMTKALGPDMAALFIQRARDLLA